MAHASLERRLVIISLSEQRQRNLHREDIRAHSNVWMGRTHNTKKRWQKDEANAKVVPHKWAIGEKRYFERPRMRWSDSLRKEIS
uniref:Uncharacterized protein n=1 Tax=Caenorhabditis japonica TaxID=281687 RepID=A0A8R1I892_CAEJA